MQASAKKVTLAFYKDGQSRISRFIRWITRSPHYSHVEIIVGTVWVSALIGRGVVARRYKPELHGEEYDFITIYVDGSKWQDTVDFINSVEKDNKYDFLGAFFGNMLHIPFIQDPNKYFCAEIVSDILKKVGDPKIQKYYSSRITPQKLYDIYK